MAGRGVGLSPEGRGWQKRAQQGGQDEKRVWRLWLPREDGTGRTSQDEAEAEWLQWFRAKVIILVINRQGGVLENLIALWGYSLRILIYHCCLSANTSESYWYFLIHLQCCTL